MKPYEIAELREELDDLRRYRDTVGEAISSAGLLGLQEEHPKLIQMLALERTSLVSTYISGHKKVVRTGDLKGTPPLFFTYRNHRDEVSERHVVPEYLWHGTTPDHPEPTWLLHAFDLDRNSTRDFAVNRIVTTLTPPVLPEIPCSTS